ncbi:MULTISPECIES: presqualene diphosphate synthase HpnD [unclassified Uliginosibacterium]|uniref:presqualene diphosphate synthase HpnD n=1 Tax=unclassified Uliginosibacterium TaxID=2621521 RepID=UPI000C7DD1C5|nr:MULTISPECIES: presqualene diphosphate synthase HpnD [unclassified Uliginosibacterium]MDO6385267.1 presqualene diphosphate synthase HpnD [Uliginosibacterium sp. 31-12]PLK47754.1 squalene synthase HpnD [Uliginosibacterium sp. TH139]
MTPDEYCEQKAAASGSSFYYSFRFLTPDRRRAITALYAFCREVDDVVDETHDPEVAARQLDWWRLEVSKIYAGEPDHPVGKALVQVVRDFRLPQEQLLEIIDGMQMDLEQARYADFKDLQLYCYRVASVVGLLAAEIFGYTNRQTLKYAHDLGIAFQLTNIIRDVGEDARRGRIYLPVSELEQFNVPAKDILDARSSENFQRLMAFQIERAQKYYDQALAQLPAEDRKSQRAGLIMAAIYRETLHEVEADGCRVLTHRVSLTPLRKLWLAVKAWIKS